MQIIYSHYFLKRVLISVFLLMTLGSCVLIIFKKIGDVTSHGMLELLRFWRNLIVRRLSQL